jgi:hypothetical protein
MSNEITVFNNDNKVDLELSNNDKKNDKIYGTDFWSENYKILFTQNNISKFLPNVEMTNIEKLNALMRLGIYLGLALFIFTGKSEYLLIIVIVGAFTCYLYYYQKDNIELFFNSIDNSNFNKIQKSLMVKDSTIKPTVDNPMMNINLITSNKTQEPAPISWNDDSIKEKIEEKYNYNLYRDVGDLYGKSNSQRQFYTMPSTTIPNNQTSFAKWCYSTGPTCKETSIYCASTMDPIHVLDDTNVYKGNNQLY